MSKILVVEPHKILQRAIAVTLFPEHEVKITSEVPEMSALEQSSYDVVIIDAGALRERDTAGDLNHRVQDWPIPVIWFEETVSAVAPVRDKLIVLRKPIARNDLLAALAQCQATGSTVPLARSTEHGARLENKETLADTELKSPSEKKRAQIIELVDVVEEKALGHSRDKRLERKKK
jgi:DNA-binding NarL/FixJ family response regulator